MLLSAICLAGFWIGLQILGVKVKAAHHVKTFLLLMRLFCFCQLSRILAEYAHISFPHRFVVIVKLVKVKTNTIICQMGVS